MKIRIVVLISILSLISLISPAQKIDRESVGYYSYTQQPLETTLVNFKTYKVINKDAMDAYKKDKLIAALNLIGFEEKEESQETDFIVEIQEYPIQVGDPERQTREETYKKDGVEKKRTYYHYTAKATFKYKVRLYANLDEIIFNDEVAGSETIKGSENASSSDAYDSFKATRKEFLNDLISSKAGIINSRINDRYCFPIKKERIESAFIKAKKFTYEDYDLAFGSMKEGYGIVANDENAIESAMPSFDKAIEGFKKMLAEADPENRKARINKSVTALLYANIGNCYFMLKEYDKAQEAFNMGGEYKNNIGDMRHMKDLSANLQKRKEVNAK